MENVFSISLGVRARIRHFSKVVCSVETTEFVIRWTLQFTKQKGVNLLGLSELEVLERLLIELEVLVHLVLELSQLHQAQLGQIDGLHLRLFAFRSHL